MNPGKAQRVLVATASGTAAIASSIVAIRLFPVAAG
jgi:hypothetical protein